MEIQNCPYNGNVLYEINDLFTIDVFKADIL